jgi:hypothetical protein
LWALARSVELGVVLEEVGHADAPTPLVSAA